MIAVLDCGLGNSGSVANMLRKVGLAPQVVADADGLDAADALVLPGVGSFDRACTALTDQGLREPLHDLVIERGVPFLGICLGMQLLARSSEEGRLDGLGWLDATVTAVDAPGLPVPHMGWNHVVPVRTNPWLVAESAPRFYFVHSYRVVCADEADVLASTTYGTPFTSAIARDNIVGVQFHPEKSHAFGMAFFESWAAGFLVGAR
jgi:glutamine amidotransferase